MNVIMSHLSSTLFVQPEFLLPYLDYSPSVVFTFSESHCNY